MVHAFDNIGVCVTNLERSVAFYEMLGLREVYGNERIGSERPAVFVSQPGR
jgi:catechol 2,3-dioxygenase-like lactoylglutathione lyase family enzyme